MVRGVIWQSTMRGGGAICPACHHWTFPVSIFQWTKVFISETKIQPSVLNFFGRIICWSKFDGVNAMRREGVVLKETGQDRSEEGALGVCLRAESCLKAAHVQIGGYLWMSPLCRWKFLVEIPQLENEESHLGPCGTECHENTLWASIKRGLWM